MKMGVGSHKITVSAFAKWLVEKGKVEREIAFGLRAF